MVDKNCLFCRIVAGEIPAAKVYEDDLVCAFLDIAPINKGHVLVIPKEHHESSSTIPEATAGRMFHVGSRIGIALRRKFDYDAFNLHLADGTAAGQVVMHAHLHVVPRGVEDGFHWNWRQLKYPEGELERTARELAAKLAAGVLDGEKYEISSTDIRRRLANGEKTVTVIPEAAADHLRRRGLYSARKDGERKA